MPLTIEMGDPQGHLLEELKWKGITQESVAITYAFLIMQERDSADWPKVNAAIRERWKGKSALNRIKKLAWAQIDEWRKRRTEVAHVG